MKKNLKSITIFLVIGIIVLIIGILGLILLGSGGINTSIFGFYVALFSLPISLIIIVIDRICVWKFGAKKVNKVQLYILAGYIAIEILTGIVWLLFDK